MPDHSPRPAPPPGPEVPLEQLGHPRGTLAIVLIFGALFGLGWIAMYVWRFLAMGAPHA